MSSRNGVQSHRPLHRGGLGAAVRHAERITAFPTGKCARGRVRIYPHRKAFCVNAERMNPFPTVWDGGAEGKRQPLRAKSKILPTSPYTGEALGAEEDGQHPLTQGRLWVRRRTGNIPFHRGGLGAGVLITNYEF